MSEQRNLRKSSRCNFGVPAARFLFETVVEGEMKTKKTNIEEEAKKFQITKKVPISYLQNVKFC